MVIAHVIDSMEVGGAEAVVAALSRLQRAAGHDVSVHCLHANGAIGRGLEAEGIHVYVHGATTFGRMASLYRTFAKLRPDVVHCHNKSATVHAALPTRLARARVLITTRHGMAALPYRLRKDLKFWVVAAMFCDRVVAVCETARRNMMKGARAVAHKVVTIRNGAYPAHVRDDGRRGDGFVLVTVGRLAPAKNYPTLLRAVARARTLVPDVRLRLVGDGPERAALHTLAAELGIADAVEFCGERADVGTLLRSADVFVLSSLSEGLPISILEAMAASLPAIVTDVGGMPEVIDLSGAGTVVRAGDVAALADAIVEFAGRRNELSALGNRARACYGQYFTPEQMANQYFSLYQGCLEGHMPRV